MRALLKMIQKFFLLYVANDLRWDMPCTFAHVDEEAFRKGINYDAFN